MTKVYVCYTKDLLGRPKKLQIIYKHKIHAQHWKTEKLKTLNEHVESAGFQEIELVTK